MDNHELVSNSKNYAVTDKELKRVQQTLSQHTRNKDFFRLDQYRIYNGKKIFEDYSHQNQRRSYFANCSVIDANFTGTGFTGSFFFNTSFGNSKLDRSVFNSCNFTDCKFFDNKALEIHNASFYESIFVNCKFTNIVFDGCMASNAHFLDVVFENCKFIGMLWENSIFDRVTFDTCQFIGLNFELCQFNDIHMNHIRLPFPTIPYIINGLKYLMNTEDNVFISSHSTPSGILEKQEYLKFLPELETFYRGTQNYFPLANIYVAQKQYEDAFQVIKLGVKMVIKLHSFHILKSYCVLLNTIPSLTPHHKKYIYDVIQKEIELQYFDPVDYFMISKCLIEIRMLLEDNEQGTRVGITINTDIDQDDYENLGVLLSVINSVISCSGVKTINHIEVRHYSPVELFCEVISDPNTIFSIIGMIYSCLLCADTLYNKYRIIVKYHLEKRHTEKQIEFIDIQKKQIEFEMQLKKQQMEGEKEQEVIRQAREKMVSYNITIGSITHSIINRDILDCDNMLQNHSEEGKCQRKGESDFVPSPLKV